MSIFNNNTIETLEDAANAFRDHEDVTLHKIEEWSNQFGDANQQLALKILKNIKYFSGTIIRQLVVELVKSICKHLHLRDQRKLLFVPIGQPYEGSAVIARALRGYQGINPGQIKHQRDLASIPKNPNIRAIVFLDIFSGTGRQIADWWTNMETLLLPLADRSTELILGILALNYKAAEVLKNIPMDILHSHYLDIEDNILSEKSKHFLVSEKKLIQELCKRTGCPRTYLYGKGDCGLLLAFKHGCPNNSLPILWFESNRWKNIFLRRAV